MMHRSCNNRAWRNSWPLFAASGWDQFGPDGPFGPGGPFGPQGPFGPGGPFGREGPFGRGNWARGSGGRGGSGGDGGKRRGRMFGAGELRLVLLRLIADEPRHGYELIKALEEKTGGAYSPSPGTIYPTLSLLEDEGGIRQAAGGDEARKAYEATQAGRDELEKRAEEVSAIMGRLEAQGENRRHFTAPEMFRAVGNLATVLKNKARSGALNEETMHEIVDLVDELARKIERL